ncbi:DUF2927 domain-containing protein [Microcoleus sp. FACHB-1515]|nr:DUF2927 domain-containing protein [Microcoleus sp. FACHB-1515]
MTIGHALPAEAQPARLTSRNPNSTINVRTAPTTQSAAPNYGIAGDRVEILSQTSGSDGYTWYRVRFVASGVQGWVRGDFVVPLAATAVRPTLPSIAPPEPSPIASPRPTVSPTPTARYTTEQINYFLEIALGAEFGSSDAVIRKWNAPIRIRVTGRPTSEDMRSLQAVIRDLNGLVQGTSLSIDNNNSNVEMVFAPESEFRRYEPNYQPTNMGFGWIWWNQNTLNRARILISTTGITQQERSHLIREELTQSLGLMQDSYRYPDSMFYQGWTDPTQFSAIDRTVISMLYRPEIRAGMTRSQVVRVLQSLNVAAPTATAPATSNQPLDFSLGAP